MEQLSWITETTIDVSARPPRRILKTNRRVQSRFGPNRSDKENSIPITIYNVLLLSLYVNTNAYARHNINVMV